jgi:hypothetical protein
MYFTTNRVFKGMHWYIVLIHGESSSSANCHPYLLPELFILRWLSIFSIIYLAVLWALRINNIIWSCNRRIRTYLNWSSLYFQNSESKSKLSTQANSKQCRALFTACFFLVLVFNAEDGGDVPQMSAFSGLYVQRYSREKTSYPRLRTSNPKPNMDKSHLPLSWLRNCSGAHQITYK